MCVAGNSLVLIIFDTKSLGFGLPKLRMRFIFGICGLGVSSGSGKFLPLAIFLPLVILRSRSPCISRFFSGLRLVWFLLVGDFEGLAVSPHSLSCLLRFLEGFALMGSFGVPLLGPFLESVA